MKNIFDQSVRDEVIARINKLKSSHQAQWGKMNADQMVRHCIKSEKLYHREIKLDQLFIGKIIGQFALKQMTKNDGPLKKNAPTHPTFIFKDDSGAIEKNKANWIALIKNYDQLNPDFFAGFKHPFFGKMNFQQVGIMAYKHTDHHLRQFGL